jgi:hypothetical protein
MRRLRFVPPVLLGALLACAKGPPPPQFAWDQTVSFQNLKSFAWYDGPPFEMPRGGGVVDGRFIDEHVRRAVETTLATKGFRKVDSQPSDILVTYYTSPEPLIDRDEWGRYNWWSPYRYGGTSSVKQGTLALDVRDPGKKLIWRGVVTRTAEGNPEKIGAAIEKAVELLLADFPPGATPAAAAR